MMTANTGHISEDNKHIVKGEFEFIYKVGMQCTQMTSCEHKQVEDS